MKQITKSLNLISNYKKEIAKLEEAKNHVGSTAEYDELDAKISRIYSKMSVEADNLVMNITIAKNVHNDYISEKAFSMSVEIAFDELSIRH